MKITKFPQSCALIESNKEKLLVDAGVIKYDESFLKYWKKADAVLITHRHSDHLNAEVLKRLKLPIYSTAEVATYNPELNIKIIKAGDKFQLGKFKIEVVKAIHGYTFAPNSIEENIGFVISDGKNTVYFTSDTIAHKTEVKTDVLFADTTAFDASLSLWGTAEMYKQVGAKLLIVAHQDGGKVMYEKSQIEKYLKEQNVNFCIPEILEVVEI